MTIRRCVAYRNEVKGQGPTKVIMVHDTPPKKVMVRTSFAEKKQQRKLKKRKKKSD
jgi:hypothetical protein